MSTVLPQPCRQCQCAHYFPADAGAIICACDHSEMQHGLPLLPARRCEDGQAFVTHDSSSAGRAICQLCDRAYFLHVPLVNSVGGILVSSSSRQPQVTRSLVSPSSHSSFYHPSEIPSHSSSVQPWTRPIPNVTGTTNDRRLARSTPITTSSVPSLPLGVSPPPFALLPSFRPSISHNGRSSARSVVSGRGSKYLVCLHTEPVRIT